MMDRAGDLSLADLRADLPRTWGSPTLSARCDDEVKYDVVERVAQRL